MDPEEILCGIDEAGRGPIAGPVTAAAVMLGPDFDRTPLRDSKRLSHRSRLDIAALIRERAISVGIGWAWPEEIDRINIHHATLLAMRRAYDDLELVPAMVQIDGRFVPELPVPAEAVIKGDATVPEISAASIVAKVARDMWMIRYSWVERNWAFEQHKGYPTKLHRRLCTEHGLSPIHRRSFSIACPSSQGNRRAFRLSSRDRPARRGSPGSQVKFAGHRETTRDQCDFM